MEFNMDRGHGRRQRPSSAPMAHGTPSPPQPGMSRSTLRRHSRENPQKKYSLVHRRSANTTPSSDGGNDYDANESVDRDTCTPNEFPSSPSPHMYRRWRLPETFLVSAAAEEDVSGFSRVVMEMERCGYFEDALLLYQNVLLTALTRLAERYFAVREEASEQVRTSSLVHRTLINESLNESAKRSTQTREKSKEKRHSKQRHESKYSSWAQIDEVGQDPPLQFNFESTATTSTAASIVDNIQMMQNSTSTNNRGSKRELRTDLLHDSNRAAAPNVVGGGKEFVTISVAEDKIATELHRVVVSAAEEYIQKANLYALHLMNNTDTTNAQGHDARRKPKGRVGEYDSPIWSTSRSLVRGSQGMQRGTTTSSSSTTSNLHAATSQADGSTLQRAQNMLDVARRLVKQGALCRIFRPPKNNSTSNPPSPSSAHTGASNRGPKSSSNSNRDGGGPSKRRSSGSYASCAEGMMEQSGIAEVILCDEDSECVLTSNSKRRGSVASVTSDEACEIPIFPSNDSVKRLKLQCTVENNVGLLFFRMQQYSPAEECMKLALLLECSLYPKRQVIHIVRLLCEDDSGMDANLTGTEPSKHSMQSSVVEEGDFRIGMRRISTGGGGEDSSYDRPLSYHHTSSTSFLSPAIRISLGVTLMNLAQVQYAMNRPSKQKRTSTSSAQRGNASKAEFRRALSSLETAETELCKSILTALHHAITFSSVRDALARLPDAREGVYFVVAVSQMRGEWLEELGFLSDAVSVYNETTRWLHVQERLGLLRDVMRATLREDELEGLEAGYSHDGRPFNSRTSTGVVHNDHMFDIQENILPSDVLRYCEEYPPVDNVWRLRMPTSHFNTSLGDPLSGGRMDGTLTSEREQEQEEGAFHVQEKLLEMACRLERCHHAMLRQVTGRGTGSTAGRGPLFLRKSIVRLNGSRNAPTYGYTQQIRQAFQDSRLSDRQPPPTPSSVTVATINDSCVTSAMLDGTPWTPPRPSSADSRHFRRSNMDTSSNARNANIYGMNYSLPYSNGSGLVSSNLRDRSTPDSGTGTEVNVSRSSQPTYASSALSRGTPPPRPYPAPVPTARPSGKDGTSDAYRNNSNMYTLPPPHPVRVQDTQVVVPAAPLPSISQESEIPCVVDSSVAPSKPEDHDASGEGDGQVQCKVSVPSTPLKVDEGKDVKVAVNFSAISETEIAQRTEENSPPCEVSLTDVLPVPDSDAVDAADAHIAISLCDAAQEPEKETLPVEDLHLHEASQSTPAGEQPTQESVQLEHSEEVPPLPPPLPLPPATVQIEAALVSPTAILKPDLTNLAKEINRCVSVIQGCMMALRSTQVVTARIAAVWFRTVQSALHDVSVTSTATITGQTHSILHTPRKDTVEPGHGKRSSSRSLNVDVHAPEADDLRDVGSEPSSARKRVVGWNNLPLGSVEQNYNSSCSYRSIRDEENGSSQSIPLDPAPQDTSSSSYSVVHAQFPRFGNSPVSVPSLSLGGIVSTQTVYSRKTKGRFITAMALRESSSMIPQQVPESETDVDANTPENTTNATAFSDGAEDGARGVYAEGSMEQLVLTPNISHSRIAIPRPHAAQKDRGHSSAETGTAPSHLLRAPYSTASSVSSFHHPSPHVSVLSDLVSMSSRYQYGSQSNAIESEEEGHEELDEEVEEEVEENEENDDDEEEEEDDTYEGEEQTDEEILSTVHTESVDRLELNIDPAMRGADGNTNSEIDTFSELTRSTTNMPTEDGQRPPPRVNTTAMHLSTAANSSSHVSSALTSVAASDTVEKQNQHKYYFVESAPESEGGGSGMGQDSEDTDSNKPSSNGGKNRLIWTHGIDALLKKKPSNGGDSRNHTGPSSVKRPSISHTAPMLFSPSGGSHGTGIKQGMNDRSEYWKKRQARYSAMSVLNNVLAEQDGDRERYSTESSTVETMMVVEEVQMMTQNIAFLAMVVVSYETPPEPIVSSGLPGILSAIRCDLSSDLSMIPPPSFEKETEIFPDSVIVDVRPPLVEHLVVVAPLAPVPAIMIPSELGSHDDEEEGEKEEESLHDPVEVSPACHKEGELETYPAEDVAPSTENVSAPVTNSRVDDNHGGGNEMKSIPTHEQEEEEEETDQAVDVEASYSIKAAVPSVPQEVEEVYELPQESLPEEDSIPEIDAATSNHKVEFAAEEEEEQEQEDYDGEDVESPSSYEAIQVERVHEHHDHEPVDEKVSSAQYNDEGDQNDTEKNPVDESGAEELLPESEEPHLEGVDDDGLDAPGVQDTQKYEDDIGQLLSENDDEEEQQEEEEKGEEELEEEEEEEQQEEEEDGDGPEEEDDNNNNNDDDDEDKDNEDANDDERDEHEFSDDNGSDGKEEEEDDEEEEEPEEEEGNGRGSNRLGGAVQSVEHTIEPSDGENDHNDDDDDNDFKDVQVDVRNPMRDTVEAGVLAEECASPSKDTSDRVEESNADSNTDQNYHGDSVATPVVSTTEPSSSAQDSHEKNGSSRATHDGTGDGSGSGGTDTNLIAFHNVAASDGSTVDPRDDGNVDHHSMSESKQSTFFLRTQTTSITDMSGAADPHRESYTSYATMEKFIQSAAGTWGVPLNPATGRVMYKRVSSSPSSSSSNRSTPSSVSSTSYSFGSLKLPRKRRRLERLTNLFGSFPLHAHHGSTRIDDGSGSTPERVLASLEAKRKLLIDQHGSLLSFKKTVYCTKGFYSPTGRFQRVMSPTTNSEEKSDSRNETPSSAVESHSEDSRVQNRTADNKDLVTSPSGPSEIALSTDNNAKSVSVETKNEVVLVQESSSCSSVSVQHRIQRLRSTKLSYVLDLSVSSIMSHIGGAGEDSKSPAMVENGVEGSGGSSGGSALLSQGSPSKTPSYVQQPPEEIEVGGTERERESEEEAENEESPYLDERPMPDDEAEEDAEVEEENEEEDEELLEVDEEQLEDEGQEEANNSEYYNEENEEVENAEPTPTPTDADANESYMEEMETDELGATNETTREANRIPQDDRHTSIPENSSIDPRLESTQDLASPLENTARPMRKSGAQTRSFHSSVSATPTSVASSYAAVFSTAPPPPHPGDGSDSGFPPLPLNNFYVNCLPRAARQGSVTSARDMSASANTERSPRPLTTPNGEAFPPSVAFTHKNVSDDEEDGFLGDRRMNRARDSSGDTLYFGTTEDGTEIRVKVTAADVPESLRNAKGSFLSPLYSADRHAEENNTSNSGKSAEVPQRRRPRAEDSKTSTERSSHRPSSHVNTYINTNSSAAEHSGESEKRQKSVNVDSTAKPSNSPVSVPLYPPQLSPSLISAEAHTNTSFPLVSSVKKDRVRFMQSTFPGSTTVQITDTQSVGESSRSNSVLRTPIKTMAENVLGHFVAPYTPGGNDELSGDHDRESTNNSRVVGSNESVEYTPQVVYGVPSTPQRSTHGSESSGTRSGAVGFSGSPRVEFAALWELLGDDPNWEFLRNFGNRALWTNPSSNTRIRVENRGGTGGGDIGSTNGESPTAGSWQTGTEDENQEGETFNQFPMDSDDTTVASRLVSRVIHDLTHAHRRN